MRANKIILSMAVAAALPFAANATQTIVTTQTPAAVGENGTVKKAAATGPYVTNEPTAADQTHIATTAYVKGAYNDAIAAVNKVDSDKQAKLINATNNHDIQTKVMSGSSFAGYGYSISGVGNQEHNSVKASMASQMGIQNLDDALISAGTTLDLIHTSTYDKQSKLVRYDNGDEMNGMVFVLNGLGDDLVYPYDDGEFDAVYENVFEGEDPDYSLLSAGSTVRMVYEAGQQIQQTKQNQLTTTVNNTSQDISSTVAQTVNTTTPSATTLVSEAAVAGAMNNYATNTTLNSKRVRIYTTWDDDTVAATTLVPFETAQ